MCEFANNTKSIAHENTQDSNTVIHFYFGADLISVQGFFTEIKSLPKF